MKRLLLLLLPLTAASFSVTSWAAEAWRAPSTQIDSVYKPIYMMQRHQIETRDAAAIAADLKAAFEQHCAAPAAR